MRIRDLARGDIKSVEKIFDLYWSDTFRSKLSLKLAAYIDQSSELLNQDFQFFVAEDNGEIVGISAMRKLPNNMKKFSETDNPAELYVLAAKYKNRGIGTFLRRTGIKEAEKRGYTEILFYSGEKHRDSWPFHDKSDFKRVGSFTSSDNEEGFVWRLEIE